MTSTTSPKCLEASLRILDDAQKRFEEGDLYGACEKGIEAMHGYLKAVAEERGWASASEYDLYDISTDLAFETDDPKNAITLHMAAEGGLAIAFNGEQHGRWMVEGGLREVRDLLSIWESRNKPQRKVRLSQISRERQRKWNLEQREKSEDFKKRYKGVSLFERYLEPLDE